MNSSVNKSGTIWGSKSENISEYKSEYKFGYTPGNDPGCGMPRIGLTACSDALSAPRKMETESLCTYLRQAGFEPVLSPCIYERKLSETGFPAADKGKFSSAGDGPFSAADGLSAADNGLSAADDGLSSADPFCCYSGSAQERAAALMDFYRDPSVCAICDISGGDMADELLPYLDFDLIAASGKEFWGYSDLTTIINSIYTRTGKSSVLYQVRHLPDSGVSPQDAAASFVPPGKPAAINTNPLLSPSFRFIQGNSMSGIVVGGNIRCLLKLAGTEFWPDLRGKILLLESMGGRSALMISYLSQLKLLHAFEQVSGILLGTFTQMEKEGCRPDICSLVQHFAGPDIPIAKTQDIGHSRHARAIRIGGFLNL